MDNLFLKTVGKKDTVTENGAISNSSTGKAIIDQFGSCSSYMNRGYIFVSEDQETLWKENPDLALKFIFYLRMITRKVKINDSYISDNVQMGQGLKDESLKRMLWLAENHPEVFYHNIWLLPMVGSWKDIWMLMFYDNDLGSESIEHSAMFELIKQGLACEEHCDLIKKYMPRIKSVSKLKTDWTKYMNKLAIEFAKYLGISSKEYNKLKASGKAHDFQKFISNNLYENINWSHIPGKALNLLVNSKFLKNHKLEDSYINWLEKQPTVKFNGYVHELGKVYNDNTNNGFSELKNITLKYTLNKQFNELIEKAKDNGGIKGNVWCALDTSGSMTSAMTTRNGVTAYDVCVSLGIYFSTLNQGAFHKNVIMFDDRSRVKKLEGDFCDMMRQLPKNAMGGTNFQSVVDEIVRVRKKNPNIPLEDYPQTLLVVSDMQFNPTNKYFYKYTREEEMTNYEAMKSKLYEVFPQEFVDDMKFIWWSVCSEKKDFPATMEDGGCYIMSGFDGSIVSLILGGEEIINEKGEKVKPSMEEIVIKALNQEILLQATINV
ncbi:MAG: DUF2828 family protein [Bacilli bacterium]|nr:DUF2828 family protein [Bacilli bacterium]